MARDMHIEPRLVPKWPKLAWVARFKPGAPTVEVLHGPMVEANDQWCVEAVWAGGFAEGDFDRTDVVFGSGVRCRGERVIFVSSGSTLDRLWYCGTTEVWHASNSLPALLAVAGVSLRDDYLSYPQDVRSICSGLTGYIRSFPAVTAEVRVVYFSNLVWDGKCIEEIDKPDTAPSLVRWKDYRNFLVGSMERLGSNMSCPGRCHRVRPLASVSSGYDSAASAALARHAGCRDAVTLRQSTSFWRGSDSGKAIAGRLGMQCREYSRVAQQYPHEEAVWAVTGRPGILNWTLFDYPEPLCLFFTGCHGDKMWDPVRHDWNDPFVMPSIAMLGFGEFRLLQGAFHCPVPYLGVRHWREIQEMSFSDEMAPWVLGKGYDRPIPRRILEEAGIPRDGFAVRKKNTSHEAGFLWPYSSECGASYRRFLKRQGVGTYPPLTLSLFRLWDYAERPVYWTVLKKMGLKRRLQPWRGAKCQSLLFQWANHELVQIYQTGLDGGAAAALRENSK